MRLINNHILIVFSFMTFATVNAQIAKLRYAPIETNLIDSIDYNFKNLFECQDFAYNGIIGNDFKRIQIHISKISRLDNMTYTIIGKSKVNNNICDFKGKLTISSFYKGSNEIDYNESDGPIDYYNGSLSGEYELYEDSTQFGSGMFKGMFTCDWAFQDDYEGISLAQTFFPSNSFEFIGDWISYKTNKIKKCCWSDSMSPCVPDDFYFTDGAGYFVNDKYKKNGWENFSEYFTDRDSWWK